MNLKFGIDVSHCQGKIDWEKIKKESEGFQNDVKFAIIRDGYSYGDRYKDREFENNVKGCRDNNIEIYGVYHFSYALSVDDARKEARDCIDRVTKADLPISTIIFFDFEYASSDFCRENGIDADTKLVRSVTEAFCQYILEHGFVPGVYVNPDYYNRVYNGVLPDGVVVWAAKWIKWGDDFLDKKPVFDFDCWQYGTTKLPGLDEVDADVIILPDSEFEEVKMESKKSNEEIAAEVVRGEWGNGAERRRRLEEAGYNYRKIQNIVNTYYE